MSWCGTGPKGWRRPLKPKIPVVRNENYTLHCDGEKRKIKWRRL